MGIGMSRNFTLSIFLHALGNEKKKIMKGGGKASKPFKLTLLHYY